MLTPTNIPDVEPELVYAADTVGWTISHSDFPSDTYTLKYYLTGPAGESITLTGSAYNSTTDHIISEASTTTTAWTYGIYKWRKYFEATVGGVFRKYFAGEGFLTIKTAAGKSHAKIMLDLIEAALEGRATAKDLDFIGKSIGDTSVSKKPELLRQWRDYYRNEYNAELANDNRINGKATGNRVLLRFRKPA